MTEFGCSQDLEQELREFVLSSTGLRTSIEGKAK